MVTMKRLSIILNRLIHQIFNRHRFVEKTHIRYCVGCAWIEQKDHLGNWVMSSEKLATWLTPKQQLEVSKELEIAITEINKVWGQIW